MKINEVWEELREKSHDNIQSEKGILKRQTRSIQTEGHFGDIKENEDFRRFNYRSSDKVYKEFMPRGFYAQNRQHYRKIKYPDKVTKQKRLVFVRIFLFSSAGRRNAYFPTAPFDFVILFILIHYYPFT